MEEEAGEGAMLAEVVGEVGEEGRSGKRAFERGVEDNSKMAVDMSAVEGVGDAEGSGEEVEVEVEVGVRSGREE